MPVLRSFGLVVAVDVALALLSALVVLPPVLRWADRWGWVYDPDRAERLSPTEALLADQA
jgi:hypothetical protein